MSLLVAVPFCLLLLGPAAAESPYPEVEATTKPAPPGPRQPAPHPSPTPIGADGRRTLSRLPANLARGAFGVFGRAGVPPLLIGGAITGLGSRLDDNVRDRIADPDHSFATSLENLGDPLRNTVAVAGLFAVGRLSEKQRLRDVSYDLLDSVIVNWAYTTALKKVIHRTRPNAEDNVSFPSGHASNAFAIASVIDGHFGWKGALPAYLYASAVAASRLQRNKHYLSDVLGGATLGYVVGRSVVRVNRRPLGAPRSPEITLTPVIGPGLRGVRFALTF